jgi:hypothetical protein
LALVARALAGVTVTEGGRRGRGRRWMLRSGGMYRCTHTHARARAHARTHAHTHTHTHTHSLSHTNRVLAVLEADVKDVVNVFKLHDDPPILIDEEVCVSYTHTHTHARAARTRTHAHILSLSLTHTRTQASSTRDAAQLSSPGTTQTAVSFSPFFLSPLSLSLFHFS